ncbi:PREDICTED: MATH and LRR domain-containing protein PFE0570w-like isoform X2 [Acromyrmex echinatior]|uniref:MATH and LRR domain-containing protein PFE0570w-like isoform X2 n=1 Tax=Acromyrmex echinatior TaxID=103372 RepID=UPI000580FC37|nr:PREDICTED: MATH and LRR domain-containing protein PFE0570w-like isoform X2 [Acromyrmex echinatior]
MTNQTRKRGLREIKKENKTDKVLTKSVEISNGAIAHEETEILLNVNEKIEEKNLKRKIMHTKEEITCTIEKRKKLDVDQDKFKVESKPDICSIDVLPEIYLVESKSCNEQPNKDQEIKTQLIVKEKKKISYISQDVFPLFISLCLQKCPKQDKSEMAIIVDKLKRRYENLDPIYARSNNFVTFLNEKRKAITNDNKKIYMHIQEVMNEMKKRTKKKSQTSQINEIYDAVPSTSYATNNVPINAVESDNDNDSEDEDSEENFETRRKIKKILHAMKRCDAIIKKLDEEEVDFDEENNSNYMKVERYKQKMTQLYDKLCELTGENADAGRTYLRPKHLNVTRIIAVDQAITNFINCKITQRNRLKKKGSLTDNLIFPDYSDILECVNRCNEKKKLGLKQKKRERMAEKAFKELGEYLQRSRRNDYWDTFSLYLENSEDPATKDKDLAKKLADNRIEGEKQLAAVFEKYTKKQTELRDQNNEEIISEEEEEEDEDEEVEIEIESITYEDDKSDDILSVSSEEDNEKEENANKTVKVNKLSVKKNKPNINMINIYHAMDISNKTIADTSPEKCNKTIEIKVGEESNMTVSNKTISEKIVQKSCSSSTIPRNVTDKSCSSDTIPRNIVTDVDKPCSSNTSPRNVTDVDKSCSSNTIPKNVVTDVIKPCSTNIIPRNVVTNVNKPCSSSTIPRNVVTYVDKPCNSNTIPRNVVTNVNKPCSSSTIPRNVVTYVDKPCNSNTIPRNIVTNMNKPYSSSTILRKVDTISKKIVHIPICSSSSTIPRNKNVKNVVDTTSEKVHKPCSSNTIPRNDVKNMDTTNEKIHKSCSGNHTSRNSTNDMKNVDNKRQEDSLSAASTSNYTKDLAEAKVKDEFKVITDPATKKNVASMVTSMENTAEVAMKKVMDEAIANMPNNEQLEDEKKPLLRVRSFAKPPRTWQDNQHKTDKTAPKNAPKVANQIKEIVDLTNEGTVKPIATKCAVQLGNKVVPIVKRHTVFLPSNSNIISVKNITNNYLKVNTRTGQIIAPVHDIRTRGTIIRLPVQTTSQSQLQNTNVTNEVSLKGKTVLKIVPTKSIILPKPSAVQSVSKQADMSSSTTQSK